MNYAFMKLFLEFNSYEFEFPIQIELIVFNVVDFPIVRWFAIAVESMKSHCWSVDI